MANVYMLRHQAGGFIPEFVFAKPPTGQQVSMVAKLCAARYGTHHVKTEEPFWIRVVEVPLRGSEDLAMPAPPGDTARTVTGVLKSSVDSVGVSGTGTVENPPVR